MSAPVIIGLIAAAGIAAWIWIKEIRDRRLWQSQLKLDRAKKEEAVLKEELTKVTKEINMVEVDYKKRMEEYDKKYRRDKSPDSPE